MSIHVFDQEQLDAPPQGRSISRNWMIVILLALAGLIGAIVLVQGLDLSGPLGAWLWSMPRNVGAWLWSMPQVVGAWLWSAPHYVGAWLW